MALPPYFLTGTGANNSPFMGLPILTPPPPLPYYPYPPPSTFTPIHLPKLPPRMARKATPSSGGHHGATTSSLESSFPFPVWEPKLDCEEEPQVELEDKGLWERFHGEGNEMVITRSGRRMFPPIRVKVTGLSKKTRYVLLLDMVSLDNCRHKYQNGKWSKAGKADPVIAKRAYVHPDSPRSGAEWMQREITFYKLKLSNSFSERNGLMTVNSMHKYQPRVHVVAADDFLRLPFSPAWSFQFPETQFYAVTAYQNDMITQMKIDHNPYAKGFRESGAASREKKKLMLRIPPYDPTKESDDITTKDDEKHVSMDVCMTPLDEVNSRAQKPVTTNTHVTSVSANQQEHPKHLKDEISPNRGWTDEGMSVNDQDLSPSRPFNAQNGHGTATTTTTQETLTIHPLRRASENLTMEEEGLDDDLEVQTEEETEGKVHQGKTDSVHATGTKMQAVTDQDRQTAKGSAVAQVTDAADPDSVVERSTYPACLRPGRVRSDSGVVSCMTTDSATRRLFQHHTPSRLYQEHGDLVGESVSSSDLCRQRAVLEDVYVHSVFADFTKHAVEHYRKDSASEDGVSRPTGCLGHSLPEIPKAEASRAGLSASAKGTPVTIVDVEEEKVEEEVEVAYQGRRFISRAEIYQTDQVTDMCKSLVGRESCPGYSVPGSFTGHSLLPYLYALHQCPLPAPPYPLPYLLHPLMLRSAAAAAAAAAGPVLPPLPSPSSVTPSTQSPGFPHVLFP